MKMNVIPGRFFIKPAPGSAWGNEAHAIPEGRPPQSTAKSVPTAHVCFVGRVSLRRLAERPIRDPQLSDPCFSATRPGGPDAPFGGRRDDNCDSKATQAAPIRSWFIAVLFSFFMFPSTLLAASSPWDTLAEIPVQQGGRIKPLQSYAQEAVRFVTGAEQFEGYDAKELVWLWTASPETWNARAMIPVDFRPLREEFKLMLVGNRLSPELILEHEPFVALVREAAQK